MKKGEKRQKQQMWELEGLEFVNIKQSRCSFNSFGLDYLGSGLFSKLILTQTNESKLVTTSSGLCRCGVCWMNVCGWEVLLEEPAQKRLGSSAPGQTLLDAAVGLRWSSGMAEEMLVRCCWDEAGSGAGDNPGKILGQESSPNIQYWTDLA